METPNRKFGEWGQFDRYCKLILYHEAIDYLREMQRRRDMEISLDELSPAQRDKLSITDDYPCESYVFDSHEGFTRAFAREFGVTPKQYSVHPKPIRLFLPSDITSYYRYQLSCREETTVKQVPSAIFVQNIERPARRLILKRGKAASEYFAYCEEVGCDVWGILVSIKEALYEPIGMWLPESMRAPGTSEYAQGVEVPLEYDGEIPEGFDCIELPACKIMALRIRTKISWMPSILCGNSSKRLTRDSMAINMPRGCAPFPACADGVPWLHRRASGTPSKSGLVKILQYTLCTGQGVYYYDK